MKKKRTPEYSPVNTESVWQGRHDALPDEYVFQKISPLTLDESCNKALDVKLSTRVDPIVLLGFESDEGVKRNLGRTGAAKGPNAFRKAFGKLPSHRDISLFDAGNIICNETHLEQAQSVLGDKVALLLDQQVKPVVIGGGHETAWGHFQGIFKYFTDNELDINRLAILNFDAHFDCRPLVKGTMGSSGTPFYQVHHALDAENKKFNYFCAGIQPLANTKSLFEYAHQHHVHYMLAENIRLSPFNTNFVEYIIDQFDFIYVSICLDVFHASVAPGVSAPQPLGIYPDYVIKSLRKLRASEKVVSLDIVELSPAHDIDDRTARLAAHLAAEYIL